MRRSPIHNAFSVTLLGLVLLVPSLFGCELRKSNWTFVGCTWSDSIPWPEFWVGAALLMAAGYMWRRAIVTMRAPLSVDRERRRP
jgi:hypothetical protein